MQKSGATARATAGKATWAAGLQLTSQERALPYRVVPPQRDGLVGLGRIPQGLVLEFSVAAATTFHCHSAAAS
jgi:hypothetical protein